MSKCNLDDKGIFTIRDIHAYYKHISKMAIIRKYKCMNVSAILNYILFVVITNYYLTKYF